MAFVAGAVLMFLAHTLGVNIARWASTSPVRRVSTAVIVLGISAAVIYGLGLLRNEFAALAQQSGPNLGDLLRRDAVDLKAIGSIVLSKKLGTEALVLLALNVGLYVMGTIASINRHDPDPDYETLLRRQERARAAFNARKVEYDRRSQKVHDKFDPQIEQLGRAADEARQQLAKATAARDAWADRAGDDDKVIAATHLQRKFAYMGGYLEGCSSSNARTSIGEMLETIKTSPDGGNIVGLQARFGAGRVSRDG